MCLASKPAIPEWELGLFSSGLQTFTLIDFGRVFCSAVAFKAPKQRHGKAVEKTALRKLQIMVGAITTEVPGQDLLFTTPPLEKQNLVVALLEALG